MNEFSQRWTRKINRANGRVEPDFPARFSYASVELIIFIREQGLIKKSHLFNECTPKRAKGHGIHFGSLFRVPVQCVPYAERMCCRGRNGFGYPGILAWTNLPDAANIFAASGLMSGYTIGDVIRVR